MVLRAGALTLVGIVSLGACSSDDEPDSAGGTTSSPPPVATTTSAPPETTPTTRAPTPEEEVLAAYQSYWKAVDEAYDPPRVDPESPALRLFATGEVLPRVVASARETLVANEVIAPPPNSIYEHRARVLAIDGETATIQDCNIDDLVRTNTVSGQVVNDQVGTVLYTAMMVRESGQWKVAVLTEIMAWKGKAGCALEQQ